MVTTHLPFLPSRGAASVSRLAFRTKNALICYYTIDKKHNTAYFKLKVANEHISISLLLEMAGCRRRTVVRCGSKSGPIPASCDSGGHPACRAPSLAPCACYARQTEDRPLLSFPAPRPAPQASRLLLLSPIRSGGLRRFQPGRSQTQSSPTQPSGPPDPRPKTPDPNQRSSPVKVSQAPPNRPALQTPDPKPQTPTEGQAQSRSVKPHPTARPPDPRPKTPDTGEHDSASRPLPRQFLHGHQYPVIWGQCRVAPRAAAPFGATPYLDMAGRLANTDGPNIYG